jgi:hypothetical protein
VSQEECAGLRENVPYVKVHRYNPKHLYPKLNVYGDNGEKKRVLLAVPRTVPVQLMRYPYTARAQSAMLNRYFNTAGYACAM